jgi:DNA-binding HxlR family transcriptional regulator
MLRHRCEFLPLWSLAGVDRHLGVRRRLEVGMGEKLLILELQELESHGIASRDAFHEFRLRVEYQAIPFRRTLTETCGHTSNGSTSSGSG